MLNVKEYFTGKVKSIGFENGSIGRASLGVMEAGEYMFSTKGAENVTILTGAVKVLLPGAIEWVEFYAGESLQIPAQSQFNVQVVEPTAYLSRYL